MLYRELKLNAPTFIQEIPFYDMSYDAEELSGLNANHILLLGNSRTEKQLLHVKRLLKGNIYEVNSFAWLSYSAWGHERVLSDALEILA